MTGFNTDEIFELAEQLERNGSAFYREAAAYADGRVEELLLRLAAMEDEHEQVCRRLRQAHAGKAGVTDPEGLGAHYLHNLMRGQVFDDTGAYRVAGSESLAELLDRAIDFEKEAIIFFTSMRRAVSWEKARDALDRLIGEELGHMVDLQEQKSRLA